MESNPAGAGSFRAKIKIHVGNMKTSNTIAFCEICCYSLGLCCQKLLIGCPWRSRQDGHHAPSWARNKEDLVSKSSLALESREPEWQFCQWQCTD